MVPLVEGLQLGPDYRFTTDVVRRGGVTSLMAAATASDAEVVELLLERGARVDGRTEGHHCELPLLQAAWAREAEPSWSLAGCSSSGGPQ